MIDAAEGRSLLPSPTLPIVYFAGAHVCLALALAALAVDPGMAGAFYYHPRVLALVHLVTLGWISGSILGALYVVAPLAFGVSMRATGLDAVACLAFWGGLAGMVSGFWQGRYEVVGRSSVFVLGAIVCVGVRVIRGLRGSRAPAGVSLHVVLAFANITLAGGGGWLLALNHLRSVPWSPLLLAAAHSHLAVLGWATMMIVGVSYRLIPMFLPAAMPRGGGLVASAVLLEIGALGVAGSLALGRSPLPWLAIAVAALAVFLRSVRWVVRHRRPRPVELPRHDWSTWQTHVAILYLMIAAALGLWLATRGGGDPTAIWIYGAAGLLGFVSQMVLGIAGRLLPMHAWYRAYEQQDQQPARSAHSLIAPWFALAVFVCWAAGLPLLVSGIAAGRAALVGMAAATLAAGVAANAVHLAVMVRRATRTVTVSVRV